MRSFLVAGGLIALLVPSPVASQRLVPYVPTAHEVVDRMLALAQVTKDDVVFDLGSGDGRIPKSNVSRTRPRPRDLGNASPEVVQRGLSAILRASVVYRVESRVAMRCSESP